MHRNTGGLNFSIDVDKIDTYACSVPDVMAAGGTVTDDALEASGSVVVDCINRDKKMRKRRRKAKQTVPVRFYVSRDLLYVRTSRIVSVILPMRAVKSRCTKIPGNIAELVNIQ